MRDICGYEIVYYTLETKSKLRKKKINNIQRIIRRNENPIIKLYYKIKFW